MIALLTTFLFLQSLCARWITSAKARAKTVFGHLKSWTEFQLRKEILLIVKLMQSARFADKLISWYQTRGPKSLVEIKLFWKLKNTNILLTAFILFAVVQWLSSNSRRADKDLPNGKFAIVFNYLQFITYLFIQEPITWSLHLPYKPMRQPLRVCFYFWKPQRSLFERPIRTKLSVYVTRSFSSSLRQKPSI